MVVVKSEGEEGISFSKKERKWQKETKGEEKASPALLLWPVFLDGGIKSLYLGLAGFILYLHFPVTLFLSLSLSLSLLTQSPTVLCSSITIIMLRYADFFLVFTVLVTLPSVKKLSLFLLRRQRRHWPPARTEVSEGS